MSSNDTPVSIPPQEDLTEVRKPTSLLVAQFFLFPLIIIAFGIGIFILFGAIAFDERSAEEYLAEIRAGGGYLFESRRWQAAYELANVIETQKDDLRDSPFVEDLLDTYVAALPDHGTATDADWQLRKYLANSMGKLGSREFVPALIEGLRDPDPETQFYTLDALGKIGDPSAAPAVAGMLSNEDAGVRKMAAFTLGVLGNPAALQDLRVALNDPAVDVRWNAAIALARLDDRSGADVLLQLTDRAYLAQFADMSEELKNENIINAVKALGLLRLERARESIVLLSTEDPNYSVRSAALAALETY